MKINERLIKISGAFPIDQRLRVDQELEVKIVCSVVKTETKSKQDGSVDRVYVCKPTAVEVFQ